MVLELTKDNFDETIKEGFTVVDFWASWCGPCKMMAPVFEKVGEELKDKATFGKVNVEEHQELAQKFQVMSIPTLLVIKDGKEHERLMGFMSEEEFKAKMNAILG